MADSSTPLSVPAVHIRPEQLEHGSSLWHDAWHRLAKNKLAVFGGITLVILTIACVLGPLISTYSYEDQNLNLGASPPSLPTGWAPIPSVAICWCDCWSGAGFRSAWDFAPPWWR